MSETKEWIASSYQRLKVPPTKTEAQAKSIKARLGGPLEEPLLDVGGNALLKGFEEVAWNGLLEASGYPVRSPRPASAAAPPSPAPTK